MSLTSSHYDCCSMYGSDFYVLLLIPQNHKERMVQLQAAQKGAEVTSEATERELELEAQLVEARSIIQEQVIVSCFAITIKSNAFTS